MGASRAPSKLADTSTKLTEPPSKLAGASTKLTEPPAKLAGASTKLTEPPAKLAGASTRLAEPPAKLAGASTRLTEPPAKLADAPTKLTDPPPTLVTPAPSLTCAPPGLATPSPLLMAPPKDDDRPGDLFSALPATDIRGAVKAFVGSKEGQAFIVSVIRRRLGNGASESLVDDIQQSASERLLKQKNLPWTFGGIRGWVGRVTRLALVDFFRAGAKDKKYVDPGTDSTEQADKDTHGADERARARLLVDWLMREAAKSPKDLETLRLLMEHEVDGVDVATLAKREGTTENAITARFYKLRKKYAPRLALLDDERNRRFLFLWLPGFFALAGLAALLWWLFGPAAPAPVPPPPPVVPAPTASAPPAPSFDQALPPPPPPGPLK